MIVPGSTSQSLSAALAAELGEPLATVERTDFPDGEFKLRLGDGVDEDSSEGGSDDGRADSLADADRAMIVGSTTSAEAHLELLQLQDAAREAGVEEVVTVVPYMGYGRQDRAFEAGEPVTARAVAGALGRQTDRVLTVTPHEERVCEFFDAPATAVEAVDRLATPLPELSEPLFLAPDEGARNLARTVRDAYGAGDVDHFVKHRHSGTEVEIEPGDAAVDGRDVVVVDDIVATGSTMSESIAVLNERDAERVFVTCVHALLARDARTKLARAGVEAIHATDTIERPVSTVSAAPAVADALRS